MQAHAQVAWQESMFASAWPLSNMLLMCTYQIPMSLCLQVSARKHTGTSSSGTRAGKVAPALQYGEACHQSGNVQ